jgi:hypothetical protein
LIFNKHIQMVETAIQMVKASIQMVKTFIQMVLIAYLDLRSTQRSKYYATLYYNFQ